MNTLLLDESWDLTLNASGHIATAADKFPDDPAKSEAYGQAQDAASQLKLFQGELYYDTSQGVPYWQKILNVLPPVALMVAKFEEAALKVNGVVSASVAILTVPRGAVRQVTGTVTITNDNGQTQTAGF